MRKYKVYHCYFTGRKIGSSKIKRYNVFLKATDINEAKIKVQWAYTDILKWSNIVEFKYRFKVTKKWREYWTN